MINRLLLLCVCVAIGVVVLTALVLLNGHATDWITFDLPSEGNWEIVCDGNQVALDGIRALEALGECRQRQLAVAGHARHSRNTARADQSVPQHPRRGPDRHQR